MHNISRNIVIPLLCILFSAGTAAGEGAEHYHTPLAGEPSAVTLGSFKVEIPANDRSSQTSLSLGTSAFFPALGNNDALPIAALYDRRYRPDLHSRLVFSVFNNELDLAFQTRSHLELLVHLYNDTSPFPEETLVAGHAVKETSIIKGEGGVWLGGGLLLPVAPFQVDNSLRLQLFYQGSYIYAERTAESGSSVVLPPDTYVHGFRLRSRYDGLRRNLMELPHSGLAAGADLEWNHRVRWADSNYGGSLYHKDDTREYLKLSGYLLVALPVPGLSERSRLLTSIYGGTAPSHDLDRFSAFRIGVGPFPSESDDLWRCPYPGATFNQFEASDYVIGTLEYRHELLSYLYLHLRGTLAWVNRQIMSNRAIRFSEDRGEAFSAGLTSGLPWNSMIYLEYSHDSGILRNGSPGDGMMVLWSKSF